MLLRMFRPGLFSALLALLATPAAAVDYVVGGAMLSLKDVAYPGRGPVVLSLEDASIPVPLPGSADDPSLSVMRVTLFGRGSGESSARDTIPSSGLWVVSGCQHCEIMILRKVPHQLNDLTTGLVV